MKFLNFKIGIAVLVLLTVSGVIFWQKTQMRNDFGIFETNQDGLNIDGGIATASAQTVPGFRRANNRSLNGKNAKRQDKDFKNKDGTTTPISVGVMSFHANTANSAKRIIPFGINNPFSYPDTDIGSERCVKDKSVLKKTTSYSENHIGVSDLKNCLPAASGYMNNIKDIGINVISRYFTREYDKDGMFNFESGDRGGEAMVQLFVEGFGNYFWVAISPVSSKGFAGDINIKTHKIIKKNESDKKKIYLPASEAGFVEWQKWLNAVFDYLSDHNALDKLVYIQIGNESDGEYVKKDKIERDNPDDFYWSDYAKLVEKSYDIIRLRSPKTKIAIGSMGAGSVAFEGFHRPVLKYLAGKINEKGDITKGSKKCGGSGCFDVFDYHDFSSYKEYGGRTACQPRDCVSPIIKIQKTPQNMNKLLSDSGFFDKKLVIQQGGTYTGQDGKVSNLKEYQSEEDQASYLAKRAIYLFANSVEQLQSGTYIEHSCQDGMIHNWFTMMGFAYNGIPQVGGDDCAQTGKKVKRENVSFGSGDCGGQLPCPDPGVGVKKLSYFTVKKLIEVLKGSDWDNLEAITTGRDDVHLYKIVSGLINVGDSKKFYDMETGNESGNIYAATDKGLFVIDKDDKITKLNIPQISSLSDLQTAVEIHPKNENVIYFASDRSEILRSTDRGKTWQEISKDIPTLGFVVLKIDPNKDIIYAEAPGAGIWKRDFTIGTEKSDWRLIGPGGGGKITSIAEDPSNPDNLYMTINVGGARKSVDGGKTWEIINRGFDYGNYGKRAQIMMDIAVHPKMGDVVLAASLDKYIYSSSNGGRLWEVSYKKPKSDNAYSQIAFDPTNNNVAYVGVGSIQSLILGVQAVRSGNFWPKIADGPTILRGELDEKTKKWHWGAVGSIAGTARAKNGVYLNIYSIAVNPEDAKELFFMTEKGLYKGRLEPDNTIKKFMLITKGLPSPDAIHGGKIVFDPVNKNIAYLTALNLGLKKEERTLGGVFKSEDGGNSWQKLTSGLDLKNSNYFDIEIDPKDPKVVYVGQFFNDAGGSAKGDLYRSVDSGQHWASIVDWSKITAGWKEYKKIAAEFINISRYGQTARLSTSGGILLENKNIGTGSSWNNILTKEIGHGEWTTTGSEALAPASSIAVDPKNSDIIYLPYGDHAYFKSENGGRSVKIIATFEEMRKSGNNGDSGTLIVDEIDSGRIYAATRGPHQNMEDGGVMYSKDYGKTWNTIGGHTSKGKERNIPRAAMMDMLVEYAGEKRNLYVASYGNSEQDAQGGVYFLDDLDGADSWQNIFPMDNTHSIAARKGFDVIYAGVDEKGLYKLEKTGQPLTGRDDVHLYKIVKDGKTNYFAWWDWWNKCPRPDSSKPEMNTACIDKNKPAVSIDVGDSISQIKITEIVPDFDSGAKAEKAGYVKAFKSDIVSVKDGMTVVSLGVKPVYIEAIK